MLFYTMNIEGGTIFTSWDEVSACALSFCCVTRQKFLTFCKFFWRNYLFISVTINYMIIVKSAYNQIYIRLVLQNYIFRQTRTEGLYGQTRTLFSASCGQQKVARYLKILSKHTFTQKFLELIHFLWFHRTALSSGHHSCRVPGRFWFTICAHRRIALTETFSCFSSVLRQ
jgi:hypothetical protein